MSEWQNKPNFEINKAVVLHRFNPSKIEQYGDKVYMVFEGLASCNRTFDGCNDPSDAWPIIVENEIDIEFAVDHLGGIGQAHVYIVGDTDIFCEFTDDNNKALRAAMIVYLEMNGVKPE